MSWVFVPDGVSWYLPNLNLWRHVCGRPYFRGISTRGLLGLRPVGRRPFSGKEVIGYIIAQVVGGIIAAAVLYVVASGKPADAAASGFPPPTAMAANTPAVSMLSAIVIEIVLTCGSAVIHGATDKDAPAGAAPSPSTGADPHPFDQHSSHQHLGQPGAQ